MSGGEYDYIIVQLWGIVHSDNQVEAAQVAAETTQGVKGVENNLRYMSGWVWSDT